MSVLPTFHFPQGTLISFDSQAIVVSGFCRDGLIVWDRALEQETAQERASISAWESATDKERNDALMKEARCLASQKVLQGAR